MVKHLKVQEVIKEQNVTSNFLHPDYVAQHFRWRLLQTDLVRVQGGPGAAAGVADALGL
jgi:hypothetical protein